MDEDSDLLVKAVSCVSAALENKTTNLLSASDFRVFIDCSRKCLEFPNELLQKAQEVLLAVLISHRCCNDGQIVVATAYASIAARRVTDPEQLFEHFSNLLTENKTNDVKIFLCHAILQLNNSYRSNVAERKKELLLKIFKVVENLCCELKSTTFLAFKVFHNLLHKINEEHSDEKGISSETFNSMLNIVMSNWENPLTGVRQQNSLILGQLLLFDEHLWDTAVPEHPGCLVTTPQTPHNKLLKLTFSQLSWNMKSKYFLLTAVLQKSDVSQILAEYGEELVAGLMFSLSVPHLVSAGADLYRTVLSSLSLDKWQHCFLASFVSTLSDSYLSLQLENIFNYWIPHTLKKLPALMKDLLEISSLNIFAYISLHKIGRREGFADSNWEVIDRCKLKSALEDYSDKTRTQAFSLICFSSKTLVFPTSEEFELVKKFLRQNVNSDSAALRQNSLNSFINFSVRIRDSFLKVIKSKKFNSDWVPQCLSFLDWLHTFLVSNLDIGTNYQRKMTSLELFKIALSYFGKSIERKEKSYIRKSNKDHLTLKDYENKLSWEFKFDSESSKKVLINCLFDEDSEVRYSSSSILISYFIVNESETEEFKDLFRTSQSLCSSQLFYKAEGGALLTKVLVTLALNSKSEQMKRTFCENNDSYTSVLLSTAEEQLQELEKDLLKAAVGGSFLYGVLQALRLLLTDPCSPEYMLLTDVQLQRLLDLLTRCTSYFINVLSSKSSSDADFAPSFGEMGLAIAAVVESSSLEASKVTADDATADLPEAEANNTSGDLQLTPAEQLVLSCVWLNIKECVILSSKLVVRPLSVADTRRCVLLVVSVLRRCRHKGAIESAGLALAHLVNHITTSGNLLLVSLPEALLDEFLLSLVGNRASTVSRRSAGLAILVHRLITGDARPSKPLLHSCIERLLPVASTQEEPEDSLVDLPQSQALHFLRSLVQESSLREPMAQYTLHISLVALNNLASPTWTVRNAALQLLGALVPKLVGQKPHQEEGKGHHFLALEELLTRAKTLVEMILSEFIDAVSSASTLKHSKLMPLLTLLSNVTVGLQAILKEDVAKVVTKFQDNFVQLFGSKIFNVRKLSAKAHSLFLTPGQIFSVIIERVESIECYLEGQRHGIQTENQLHGYLLNLNFLVDRVREEKIGMSEFISKEKLIGEKINTLAIKMKSSACSCFIKALVVQLNADALSTDIKSLDLVSCNKLIGCPILISFQAEKIVMHCNGYNLKETVQFCLLENQNLDIQVSCLKALKSLLCPILQACSEDLQYLLDIFITVKDFIIENTPSGELFCLSLDIMLVMLETLVKSSDVKIRVNNLFCAKFFSYSLKQLTEAQSQSIVPYSLLPIVCGTLTNEDSIDFNTLQVLTSLIKSQSGSSLDQELRICAAKSMYFLVKILKNEKFRGSECAVNIWEACVTLLQDEVTEVRYEASRFVTSLVTNCSDKVWNTFVSLECLFEYSLISLLMRPTQAVECLWKILTSEFTQGVNNERKILNPFDHDVKSIYAEAAVVSRLSCSCILDLLKLHSDVYQIVKEFCERYKSTEKQCPKILHYIHQIENSLIVTSSVINIS